MKLFLPARTLLFSAVLLPMSIVAQMEHAGGAMAGMNHKEGPPSTSLRITGLENQTKTLTLAELKAMPHVSVTVTNGHSHKQESYSGVPVKDLLALVATPKADAADIKPKVSPRMTLIVAEGTDKFRVALTLCDTDPGCRSGQAIVADSLDGQPLTTDGAFKLILSEDKMPGRWVRNLDALTEQAVSAM